MLLDSGQFSTDTSLPRNDHENSFDLRQSQQEQPQSDFLNIEPEFTGDFLFENEPLFDGLVDYPQQNVTVDTGEIQHNNQPQQDISNSGVNGTRSYFTNSPRGNDHLSPYTLQLDSLAYNQNQAYNEWGMMPERPVEHHGQQQSDTINYSTNGNSSMSMEFNSSDHNKMGRNQNQEENMYQTENQFAQENVHHIVQVTPSNEVITVRGIQVPYPSFAEPATLQKSTVFSHVFIKCGNTVESQNEVKQIDANDTPNENCRDKKKTFTPYTPAQLEILCEQFEIKNYLTSDVRDDLAQRTGLTKYQVIGWFTNRRKRIRDKSKEEAKRKKLDAARRQEAEVWVKEAIAMYDEKIISEELAGNNFD